MQRRKKTEFHLTVSHFKILETIFELNKENKYPTAKGVNNILAGKIDEETRNYSYVPTYGTLISFPGRKLCSYILNMVRREYIGYVYDEASDGLYLKLTPKGEEELFHHKRKHKNSYKKKSPHRKAEIVAIKK